MRSRLLISVLTTVAVAGAAPSRPLALRQDVPPIALFFTAASTDAREADRALEAIDRTWRNSYTSLIVDLARFLVVAPAPSANDRFAQRQAMPDQLAQRFGERAPDQVDVSAPRQHPGRARLIRFLEQQTKQRFGNDLDKWRTWMWALPYEAHPDAMRFKAELYARVDLRMRQFFEGRSLIRLDEIDWGGVKVNGIPPLTAPTSIAADRATYLDDRHVVFGIVAGGEARAYPKRILAWHEMALDTLGGERLTIVYCTLCGTVIPYRSVVNGVHRTFGTSGLLYRSNKLMFDAETNSLWSTLEGKPVVGPLAGGSDRLEVVPVVTTTWGEWRRAHPRTTVLSVATGYDRDYSEGAAYRDYFSSGRLMFRVPVIDKRLNTKDEVLGVLLPARGGGRQAVAFATAFLQRQPVHHATFEGQALVIVTSAKGANRVFESQGQRFVRSSDEQRIVDTAGRAWLVTEEALVRQDDGATLKRVPAFRAFWFGWFAQFPDTVLVK